MFRRLVPLLALALIAGLPAGSALATVPACTADTGTLRYKPEYTASCPGQTIVSVELVKTSNSASVGTTPTGEGTSDVTVDVNGTLASNMQYRLKLMVDDGSGAELWTQTFRTLKAPANPNLHVKYITAIPADAVLDMAHRIDRANVVAVPVSGDFIDASTRSLSAAAYTAALKHHQSALVVTDQPVLNTAGLGSALNQFCNQATASSSPARRTGAPAAHGWNHDERDRRRGGPWATHWSLFYYDHMTADRVDRRRPRARARCRADFLTKGLTTFHVVGPGSGAVELRDYAQGHDPRDAQARRRAFYQQFGGQFLLSRAPDQRAAGSLTSASGPGRARSRTAGSTRPRARAAR